VDLRYVYGAPITATQVVAGHAQVLAADCDEARQAGNGPWQVFDNLRCSLGDAWLASIDDINHAKARIVELIRSLEDHHKGETVCWIVPTDRILATAHAVG
jgi:hypothetical protein